MFQHFADTAELYVAVLSRVLASQFNGLPEPGETLALDGRIRLVVDRGAERSERLLPMWTFVETLQRRSSEAGEQVSELYTTNREQLAECFGQELTTLSGDKRERTLNALAMALTPESWIVLRERLGLTVDQAREEWSFIVKAIFNGR